MAFLRKIKAGLVKSDIETFVGEEGNLFFNIETGELRLSDGQTEGGIAVGGGGGGGYTLPTASTTVKGGVKIDGTTITINNQVISGFNGNYNSLTNKPTIPTLTSQLTNDSGFLTSVSWNSITSKPTFSTVATSGSYNDLNDKPSLFSGSYTDLTNKPTIPGPLTVSLIDATNTVSSPLTNITAIRFDTDSGFDITDLGSGAVKIGMNSTFKTWKVDGQNDLIATGLDTIEFIAGSGVLITTDTLSDPKSITFKTIDKTVTLYQDGILEPTTGTVRWYNPRAVNINKITARLAEAADSTVTVIVKKNGTNVQTLNFSTGSVKQTATVDIDMIVDDYLTVDITAVGSVNRGRGLSVEFTYSFE